MMIETEITSEGDWNIGDVIVMANHSKSNGSAKILATMKLIMIIMMSQYAKHIAIRIVR